MVTHNKKKLKEAKKLTNSNKNTNKKKGSTRSFPEPVKSKHFFMNSFLLRQLHDFVFCVFDESKLILVSFSFDVELFL
jgi:hypothetical protein